MVYLMGVYISPIRKERFWGGFVVHWFVLDFSINSITAETYSSGVRKLNNIYVQMYITGNV